MMSLLLKWPYYMYALLISSVGCHSVGCGLELADNTREMSTV
jgi:hypothetical protein